MTSTPTATVTNLVPNIPDVPAENPAQAQGFTLPMTVTDIQQILPHRYPFLLVDRIIAYEPGVLATGIKNVTMNEYFFQGHFPIKPIMPGVLIVEAMAQVGGIVLGQMPDFTGQLALFAGIDGVRFRRPVVPGDQIVMTSELISARKRFGKMKAKATVDDQLVCEGELLFSLVSV